jgi:anti-sigma regulatory factor (Ser/Thr protein kinase)
MTSAPREPQSWSRVLSAGPRTAAEARAFISEVLRQRDDVVADPYAAALLTSEVATNAARHGKEPIELSISLEEDSLRVSVFDHGDGFDPAALEPRPEGGWGLMVLDSLSSSWGVDRRQDGTEVWFRI